MGLSMLKSTKLNFEVLAVLAATAVVLYSQPAFAQTGGEIFRKAASTISCDVMPGKFGAMVSGFAGIFALISAATGSYRGAWALLFVSIGAFLFPEIIQIFFTDSIKCGKA